jgi:hypothetical protein
MLLVKKFDFDGFNVSFIKNENGYLATLRKSIGLTPGIYPEAISEVHILQLDSNFNFISTYKLPEYEPAQKFISYSAGIEDPRLITENSFIGVSLDTNYWKKPELIYVEFDNKEITLFKPLYIKDEQHSIAEKNWLYLKKRENFVYFLYSYNPFQIICTDMNIGSSKRVLSYNVPELSMNSHGGACIYLEKEEKYLVLVRNFIVKHKFENNSWLLFDKNFILTGYSNPFVFPLDYYCHYQMCFSFTLEGNNLFAIVSINDSENYLFSMNLSNILSSINVVSSPVEFLDVY